MLLLLGLGIIILVCAILFMLDIGDCAIWVAGMITISIALVLVLCIIPLARYETRIEIVAFIQVKHDINVARRSELDPVERASLTSTIIESNVWLAKKKYKNEGFWDIFIPDEIDYVKKLQ